MRKFLLFLPILFFLGCKTIQPTIITRDSVRVEHHLDSVYIYERDSVFIDRWRAGDTVYITKEKWLTRYKDKEVAVHDTIYRDREQVIVQEVKYIPKFYKGSTIALWILIASVVIYVVIRIIIKIYARR